MLAVAIGAFMAGSALFTALIAGVLGLMVWELTRMQGARHAALPFALGGLAFGALLLRGLLVDAGATPLDLAAAGVFAALVWGAVQRDLVASALYACALGIAGLGVVTLVGTIRGELALLALLGVVILTDVAGYFAGRFLGGPKFWPAVSPKKTWSGVLAGWLAAGVFGVFLGQGLVAPLLAVLAAVALSFASQMGDIAESALKRRAGVKDASDLIPGHGGFLDRFDGVVGAALVLTLIMFVTGA